MKYQSERQPGGLWGVCIGHMRLWILWKRGVISCLVVVVYEQTDRKTWAIHMQDSQAMATGHFKKDRMSNQRTYSHPLKGNSHVHMHLYSVICECIYNVYKVLSRQPLDLKLVIKRSNALKIYHRSPLEQFDFKCITAHSVLFRDSVILNQVNEKARRDNPG